MTSAAIGIDEPEDALGGDVGEGPLGAASSTAWASSPNSSAPTHGSRTAAQRLRREARLQRVDEDRDERASAARPRRSSATRRGHRTSSRNRLSSESSSGAHLEQADRRVAGEPGQRDGQLAGPHGLDHEPVAHRVERHARRPTRGRPARRPAAGRRRSARARGAAGRPSRRGSRGGRRRRRAGRGSRTITRSASRSTSLSTCELTITVRPSAPSCLNSAMRCTRCTGSAPFSGSSSTSTCGSRHERGGDLGALAHALAERRRPAGRRRRASRPCAARASGAPRSATPCRSAM